MELQSAALIGSGIAIGFATLGPGIGIGMAVSAMLDSSARQPELAGKQLTNMFIGAALIEVLALLGFLISIMLFNFGTAAPEMHAPPAHDVEAHVEIIKE